MIQGRVDGVFAEGERRTNRTDRLNLRVEPRGRSVGLNVRWEEERMIPPFGASTPGRTEARGALSLRWENWRRGRSEGNIRSSSSGGRVSGAGGRGGAGFESVYTAGVTAAVR